jgi:predicted MFS family arabinose efflux permease
MDFMVMMPLGPQLKRVFDMSPSEWSLIVSSYTFAAFVSGVGSIFIIDRFDRKKILIAVYSGFLVGTFLCGIADSYVFLISARICAGIFGGVIGAVVLSIVGDLIPLVRRGKAMGIVMTGFSAAAALGVPTGLLLGTIYDWHFPFLCIVGMGLIILVLLVKIIPSALPQHKDGIRLRNKETLIKIFSDLNKIKGFSLMGIIIFGQFLVIPFLSPYMVANVGFAELDLTLIYFCGGILSIFTSPWVGKMSDKHGRSKVFTWFVLLSTIPILAITHFQATPMWVVLLATTLFFITVAGRFIPAIAIVLSTAEPEIRGRFMSIRSAVQQLVAGIAAFASGLIMVENADGTYSNYNIIGYISVLTCLATLLLVRRIKEKY